MRTGLGFPIAAAITAAATITAASAAAGANIYAAQKGASVAQSQIKQQQRSLEAQLQMAREQREHELRMAHLSLTESPVGKVVRLWPWAVLGLAAWWALKA